MKLNINVLIIYLLVFFEPDTFFRVQNVFNNFLYMIDA